MTSPLTTAAFLLPLASVAETLPVLFGRDGDFEGAPPWRPAVWVDFAAACWGPPEFLQMDEIEADDDGIWLTCAGGMRRVHLSVCSLDLRIPSVAARVAGLCARVVEGDRVIYPCGDSPVTAREFLAGALQSPVAGGFDSSLAADLASLFLSLAPRIAALGVTRD